MVADLFESYTGSIVATVALGATAIIAVSNENARFAADTDITDYLADPFILPFAVMAIGIVASVIGTFLVRTNENANMGQLLWALRIGIFGASGLALAGTAAVVAESDAPVKVFDGAQDHG